MNVSTPWRKRLSELGRGVGKPHAPLFAPLLYGVASQIEALPPADVTADPTRLAKCLVELKRVMGTSVLVTAAPTSMEAEALGASVDRETWPPKVTASSDAGVLALAEFDSIWRRSEALSASLEVTQRLASTQTGEPVLLAALTGPAALLRELLGDADTPEAWDFAGRALSALFRQFAQAGASAILLVENTVPADAAAWSAALNTVCNVARFHRIPALLAFRTQESADWPASTIACPSRAHESSIAKPHGVAVSPRPLDWLELSGSTGSARIAVTAGEVAADTSIEALREACEVALEMERA